MCVCVGVCVGVRFCVEQTKQSALSKTAEDVEAVSL